MVMKHLRLFEEYKDAFYWEVETKWLKQSLPKISAGNIKMSDMDMAYLLHNFEYEERSYPFSPKEMYILYDGNNWSWTFTWDTHRIKGFSFMGKIELEDYEKSAEKYNL